MKQVGKFKAEIGENFQVLIGVHFMKCEKHGLRFPLKKFDISLKFD